MRVSIAGLALAIAAHAGAAVIPAPEQVDAEVPRALRAARAKAVGVAVIDAGRVVYLRAFGPRNEAGEPLGVDTVMYGASLTKPLFAYTVTARILLSHRSGFANFGFLEPDGRLRIHFEPGSRYAYSGDGLMLLQFVLERGLGIDVGREMQRRVFDRFGMRDTGMVWRDAFAVNLADGYAADGTVRPHSRNRRVRVAGSMDTSLDDFARFAAGFMRGEGLSAAARAAITAPQWPITTASQ